MGTLSFKRTSQLVAAFFGAILLAAVIAAPDADAAKPVPTQCGTGQSIGSFKVGRQGVDATTVDPTYTVQMSGASLIVAPVEPYTLTGTIAKKVFTATANEVFAPDTATIDNPFVKGKTQTVTVCGDYYPNGYPAPTTTGTLQMTCYAATYADRNWEFMLYYSGGTVDHTIDWYYSDVETGLTETRTDVSYAGDTAGGAMYEQANIGDHVTMTVWIDGVEQPDFAFNGVVDATMPCGATATLD